MVTGGAGYIGSHVVRLLGERGESVVVVDDLSTGLAARVEGLPLVRVDLSTPEASAELEEVIRAHGVTSVIHFAAKKQVGESMERPTWYYRQNVVGLANLLDAMDATGVTTMVFSSSAAVYGMPDVELVAEDSSAHPINPYGETKLIGEWMIANAARSSGLRAVKLRYFNVAGAGWPDLADTAVMNLVPIVINRLRSGRPPVIFGDDYDTPDGTCIRDYVHVRDLAEAHIAALEHLASGGVTGDSAYNVGTGRGASVSEVLEAIREVSGLDFAPQVDPRRPGDPPQLVADIGSIGRDLVWKAEYGLHDIVESAWRA